MTLDTLPDGSHSYIPPTGQAGIDRFGIQRPGQQDKTQRPLRKTPVRIAAVKGEPGLYQFEQTIDEFRGGLYKWDRGPWSVVNGYLLSGNADVRTEGYCSNLLATASQTPGTVFTSQDYTLQSCVFGGKQVIAQGEFSNDRTYLYTEGPSTGVISRLTYNKGAGHTIYTIAPVLFNSTTYLVVGKSGNAAEALTNVASPPTSAGAMDISTLAMYWICNTDREDTAVVAQCGSTIVAWSSSAAFNSAPTVQESNVVPGGFLVGLASLNSSNNRIIYVRPPNGATSTGVQPGNQQDAGLDFYGNIYWRNMRGQDEQNITKRFGLRNVTAAVLVRGGVIATDRYQATWHNGLETRKMEVFSNAPADSDIQRLIMGFYTDNIELKALVNEVAVGASSRNTVSYILHYDWDTNSWEPCGDNIGFATTGKVSFQAANGGGLPWSPFTGNLIHRYGQGIDEFATKQEPLDSTQNVYQMRKKSGGTAGGGAVFQPSWIVVTPEYWFDGYEGGEILVTRVIGPPISSIQSGGALAANSGALDATLVANVGGKDFIFTAADPDTEWPHALRLSSSEWHPTLQLTLTGTSTVSDTDATHYAVNGLPLKIQGFIRMPRAMGVPRDTEAA